MISGAWQDWWLRCAGAGGLAVLGAAYTHLVRCVSRPGRARLLLATPVIALHLFLPLLFDQQQELISRACAAAMCTWLANFKVLLLCMGRGPLTDSSLSLGQFSSLMLWPVLHVEGPCGKPARLGGSQAQRKRAALARLTWRVPENIALALVGGATLASPHVPLFVKIYSAAFGVSAFCALCANVAAAFIIYVHGLAVAPSWDRPWLQTSPSDFWSKRWNLPASYTLRALVFDPIMEGKAIPEEPVPPPPPYPAAPTLLSSAPHGPITPPGAPSSVQQAPAAHEGVAAGMLGQAAPLLAGGEGELAPSTTSSPVGYVLVGREQDQSIPPAREHSAGSNLTELLDLEVVPQHERGSKTQREGVAPYESQASASEIRATVSLLADKAPTRAPNLSKQPSSLDHASHPRLATSSTATDATTATLQAEKEAYHSADMETARYLAAGGDEHEGLGRQWEHGTLRQRLPREPTRQEADRGMTAQKGPPKHRRPVTQAQRMFAIGLTFLVSGLMHELLLLLCTGWKAAGLSLGWQTLYFILQVPVAIMEQQMVRALRRQNISLPRWLCIPVASLTLQVQHAKFHGELRRAHDLKAYQRDVQLIKFKYCEDIRPASGHQLEACSKQHETLCRRLKAKKITLNTNLENNPYLQYFVP